jgi:peptidyl-prolyl cis-trans isomerase SurA
MRIPAMALLLLIVWYGAAAYAEGSDGIVAVVDDQAISTLDVNNRIALVMVTTGIPDTPENRARIAPQVLHQLVDEQLQMEEAARDGITISDAKLHEGIALLEKQSGRAPGSMEAYIDEKGLSKLSFYQQVRAQMAWTEIVIKKIRPDIRISDQEIKRFVKRKEESPKQQQEAEVLITTIQLPVDSAGSDAATKRLAEKLAGEIRAGASFEAVATQFSSMAGGPKAADPFWVEAAQLDPAIAGALSHTPKGGITEPVRTAAGYQIIKLVDVRKVAAAASQEDSAAQTPAGTAELTYKQILMTLKPDAQVKEAQLLLTLAKEVKQSPGTCLDKSMAGAGNLADLDFKITLTRANSTEMPPRLSSFLMGMKIGEVSDPIITPQGIRLLMLCERIDIPPGKVLDTTASDEEARRAIFKEKIELEAQKYMRNLRREAFIEVRQ